MWQVKWLQLQLVNYVRRWCLALQGGIDNREIDVSKAIVDCRSNIECNILTVASTLRWAVTNARSVMNKLAELHLFLQTYNLDLSCVTETWLNISIPDSLIAPKGYKVYRHDRSTRAGGVAIFVRDTAVVHQVAVSGEFNNIEVVCIDVHLYNTVYRVIGFYRPPGLDRDAQAYISFC